MNFFLIPKLILLGLKTSVQIREHKLRHKLSQYNLIAISKNDCKQFLIWDNHQSDLGSHNKSCESNGIC